MHRRQLIKSGALAGAAVAVPGVLAAAGEPLTFATVGELFPRHWSVIAPVPALRLVPGVHYLHEWVPTHAVASWRIGEPDGTNGTAILGNVWPVVLAAYVAGALRPDLDIHDTRPGGERVVEWSPDHAGLIAAHGPERALVLATAEYHRRAHEKLQRAWAESAAMQAGWRTDGGAK